MAHICIKTRIENRTPKELLDLFNEDLFRALKPPVMNLQVERFDGCKTHDQVHLKMDVFGLLNQKWISIITDHGESFEECFFVDEGTLLPPPLKSWRHRHRLLRINDHSSYVVDDITYSTGNKALDYMIYPVLYAMFSFRVPVYKEKLSKK